MSKTVEIILSPKKASDRKEITQAAAKSLGISTSDIIHMRILRRSIDARRIGDIRVNMALEIFTDQLEGERDEKISFDWKNVSSAPNSKQVVIIGAGPAGLSAALRLIELGIKPIVLERGKPVKERKVDVATICRNGDINDDSNYSFGEGGAGTFSDGKLYTRSRKRGSNRRALELLCFHGASEEILYEAHPHIGTDCLPRIVENLRKTIQEYGGEIHFSSRVFSIMVKDGAVCGVTLLNGDIIETRSVILATGHSARDIYRMLYNNGITVESKDFALGVRVEHRQDLINKIQYKGYMDEWLPAATYQLVSQVKGRGVYSFCMCPGGFIVPAMTSKGQCVVNGMSPSGRNNIYANSGIVTEIHKEDVPEYMKYYGPLGLLVFQEQVEKMAYSMVAANQVAPSQILTDFINQKASNTVLGTSYHPGLSPIEMSSWMPKFVSQALREGFRMFDRKMHGFVTPDAQIIGLESRTSSPVRIPRTDSMEHPDVKGLFPAGEGSGYAGGIISASVDGMRAAEMVKLNESI